MSTLPGVPPKPKAEPPATPGRKPRAGAPSTARIEVRVTPEEYERYAETARRRGTNLTAVVRDYLRRWAAR